MKLSLPPRSLLWLPKTELGILSTVFKAPDNYFSTIEFKLPVDMVFFPHWATCPLRVRPVSGFKASDYCTAQCLAHNRHSILVGHNWIRVCHGWINFKMWPCSFQKVLFWDNSKAHGRHTLPLAPTSMNTPGGKVAKGMRNPVLKGQIQQVIADKRGLRHVHFHSSNKRFCKQ